MGIWKRLFGQQREKNIGTVTQNNRPATDPVAELERLCSQKDKYGDCLVEVERCLRHPDINIQRAVVTSKFARRTEVGVVDALIDLLGVDYEDVAREAAKAICEGHKKEEIRDHVEALKFVVRSLRTEYEIPAHMSRDAARRGIGYLRDAIPSDEAKRLFEDMVAEIWEGDD